VEYDSTYSVTHHVPTLDLPPLESLRDVELQFEARRMQEPQANRSDFESQYVTIEAEMVTEKKKFRCQDGAQIYSTSNTSMHHASWELVQDY
jgi:hypothetical protein